VRDAPHRPTDFVCGKNDVPFRGRGFGQRKTPTQEREGKAALDAM
jgi:hypothetical protein